MRSIRPIWKNFQRFDRRDRKYGEPSDSIKCRDTCSRHVSRRACTVAWRGKSKNEEPFVETRTRHGGTNISLAPPWRALATGEKKKDKKRVNGRRGRRGTERRICRPRTYHPGGFWRILGVPGTTLEAQSWVRGLKPGRRTEDADAHRPLDPPCAGP